uniref:transposase n=1 Tax=Candidatus Oscillochloris fontis TaxID=2496868 RepID=UPI001292B812
EGQRWDDVRGLLESQHADCVDLPVTVGVTARVAARLLGVRVPTDVAEQRRQQIRAEARRAGKAVSGDLLRLAAWTIFLTNAPHTLLTVREALVLGRARWQIELLFKLWKSHGHIDESRGTQPWRVLCEVYAKLLAVVISHWVMLTALWAHPDRSLVKAARLIQKHAFHLASSLCSLVAMEATLRLIREGLQACCRMDARTACPHTYQLLMNPEVSY